MKDCEVMLCRSLSSMPFKGEQTRLIGSNVGVAVGLGCKVFVGTGVAVGVTDAVGICAARVGVPVVPGIPEHPLIRRAEKEVSNTSIDHLLIIAALLKTQLPPIPALNPVLQSH